MNQAPDIPTGRLLLRRWRPEDREPFAALNADPEVLEFFPNPLSRQESDAMIGRIEDHFREHGFGFWAVEEVGGAPFIGLVGLGVPRFEAPFMPAVEVGWRLARDSWGHGYATEAARASLAYGFDSLELEEIVAFTARDNLRSRRVMERLDMTHDPSDDFRHPALPQSHALSDHVLYRISRDRFQSSSSEGGINPLANRT